MNLHLRLFSLFVRSFAFCHFAVTFLRLLVVVHLNVGREGHEIGAMGLKLVKVLVRAHLLEAVNERLPHLVSCQNKTSLGLIESIVLRAMRTLVVVLSIAANELL